MGRIDQSHQKPGRASLPVALQHPTPTGAPAAPLCCSDKCPSPARSPTDPLIFLLFSFFFFRFIKARGGPTALGERSPHCRPRSGPRGVPAPRRA